MPGQTWQTVDPTEIQSVTGGCERSPVLLDLRSHLPDISKTTLDTRSGTLTTRHWVYRLIRCLFGLVTMLIRSDLSKDVELLVLRHENQMLRRQAGGRPRWDQADRLWLA
jgi:hypothetical protein